MRPFEYDTKGKSEKRDAIAEMRERKLLLKMERLINSTEILASNYGMLGETASFDAPQNSLLDKRGRILA